MTTTSNTVIQNGVDVEAAIAWLRKHLTDKQFGTVGLTFTITQGRVTDISKSNEIKEHFQLPKKN